MNKKQKILIIVALSVFILTLFAIPIVRYSPAYPSYPDALVSYIWDIGANDKIRFDILALEWTGIVVISIILFFILKDNKNYKWTKKS